MQKPARRSKSDAVRQRSKELRRQQTSAEEILWSLLRNRQLEEYKFRRQHPIGRFIVDFYCPLANLIIEVDGASHDAQAEYDQARTRWLEEQGLTVLRFTNIDVHQNLDAIASNILEICQSARPPE